MTLATLDSPGRVSSGYCQPADSRQQISVATVGLIRQARDKWRKVVRALESFKRLRDNWDGLGATAPSAEMVESAIDLANGCSQLDWPAPATVAPTVAGTILFTWENTDYLEIEVRSPYHAEWMHIDETGATAHGEFIAGRSE